MRSLISCYYVLGYNNPIKQCNVNMLLEVKLPYEPVCRSVGWLVGLSVGSSVIISSFTSQAPTLVIMSDSVTVYLSLSREHYY